MKTAVIIPAYQPDFRLTDLAEKLINLGFPAIYIVDDGSDESCRPVFEKAAELGCIVLTHPENKGKGRALKTAMEAILADGSFTGCITADADGQHLPEDIEHIRIESEKGGDVLILGCRILDKDVPLRSKIGNTMTRGLFRLTAGKRIYDTQTGLRAIPRSAMQKFIGLDGERYEYEMNMLVSAAKSKMAIREIPIKTVYIDNNSASHFRALADGYKVYKTLLAFSASSVLCFIIDFALFTMFLWLYQPLGMAAMHKFLATVSARPISATVNFFLNKKLIFKSQGSAGLQAVKYFGLAIVQMSISGGLLALVTAPISNKALVVLIKVPIDLGLYFCSYFIQRKFIFQQKKSDG